MVLMILKSREKPEKMLKLDALLKRLSNTHPERMRLEKDYARFSAGYKGEGAIDYYLNFLDEKDYYILHNVRLTTKICSFQIDTLILTQSFILIIEVKNITGTVLIDSVYRQLIRTINGIEECFPHPEDQAYHQKLQLIHWLEQQRLPIPPIEILVVFANQNCILKSNCTLPNNKQSSSIIHSTSILNNIQQIKDRYSKEHLSKKEIRRIANLINKHHVSLNIDILHSYHIDRKDLLLGVQCPDCRAYYMIRKNGKWYCNQCGLNSTNEHYHALDDYRLIISPYISNKEIREFLCISSDSIARKLMEASKLHSVGTTRDKQYQLEPYSATSDHSYLKT